MEENWGMIGSESFLPLNSKWLQERGIAINCSNGVNSTYHLCLAPCGLCLAEY
jgi:hypothetical protein